MARVTLTPSPFVPNGLLADPAGTASVAGAGNGFTVPYQGGKGVVYRVTNASGGSGTITVLAGAQPLAPSSGQGPAVTTVANSTTLWIGPYESARVSQPDGSVSIESSVVMTVTAFSLDGKYVG